MDSTGAICDWAAYLRGQTPCRFPRFSRPARDATAGARQIASARVTVTEQADELRALSSADPERLGAVLRTAWALLLRCYTGQDDVSFGFQHGGGNNHNNNNDDGTDAPVVARFLLQDSASVGATVSRTQAEFAGVVPAVPPELLSPGDLDRPIFDTAIVLWSFTETSMLRPVPAPQHHALRLIAKRRASSLGLFLEWSTARLGMSPSQGNLVASTLGTLLSGVVAAAAAAPPDADLPLSSLDPLSRANVDQVCAWNAEYEIEPLERCVHDVIADRVVDCADKEAICAWDGRLTYRELDAVADRLAARLVSIGVGPEVLVPLCFEKSKWTVIAMLAVLRAGGAFVPLDPSHPVERLRGLCESVGAKLVLCATQLVDKLTGVVDSVLPVDDSTLAECAELDLKDVSSSRPAVSCTNPAYVIFTSGSTGKPKGTVIEHQAFCSSARAHGPSLLIDGTCRVLQFAAHTFDASLVEILTPLMVGACVCVPSEHERLNDLAGAMNRMEVDHAVLTPSFVNFLTPATVPRLRRLVLAGEAMSRTHVATWSHIQLVNGYGPAESSVAAVCNPRVGPDTEATDIGMPCGVRVWLVDPADHNRLVPVGCVGEMILEGPTLARGYLNDPVKTQESFIFDPAWAKTTLPTSNPTRRFYKTGDLAKYNSAVGSLSYVGRKDTQIKFHGQRIELGEIEHHLAIDENIQHALVLLPKQGPLAKRLITVLSLSDPDAATAHSNTQNGESVLALVGDAAKTEPILERIRARLGEKLPAYMVPSTWLCVDAIPMLASRKMDRKTVATWVETILSADECQKILMGHVPAEKSTSSADGEHSPAPLNDVEAKLRDIWSLVLNLPADQISPDDRSFLNLGGDSISAMACASHAKKARLGLTVQDVLKAKSLRQLATCVKHMEQPSEGQVDADVEEEGAINTPFDLSPIQQYHVELRGGAEGDEHFNQSFFLRLTRHVDDAAVREAIRLVVKRHPMLRARFQPSATASGQWQQLVSPEVESSFRFRTHAVHSRSEVNAGIASAQGCLNVSKGPLFAAELFNSEDSGEQTLFMTGHHLVIDLVSWRVIMEEVEEILDKKPLTVHRSLPFRKWASLQIDDCAGKTPSQVLPASDQVPAAQFAYWGMHDRPNLYGDVACQGFELDAATTAVLVNECNGPFRTETVELLLASLIWSFQAVFTDRAPPAIFNEGHGREPPQDEVDIARTVGWFTTLFPVALSSPSSLADALIQTKDLRRRVPGNGRPYFATRFHTPEGRDRWAAHHRRMEVSFNFLGRYQQLERAGALFQPAEGALMAGEAHPGSPTADFGAACPRFSLFEVSAVIVKGALRFGFAWNGRMQQQDRIRRWVAACKDVLSEAAVTLPRLAGRITASDLALLPELSAADLDEFERTKLPAVAGERGWEAVEDVYPASPIQQGLLLSRTKDGNFYAVRRTFEVKRSSQEGKRIDASRVVQAWKDVVRHHALLRTVFVDAISQAQAESHAQVVLKDIEPLVVVRECPGGVDEMRRLIGSQEPMEYRDDKPQHRFSVFYDSISVFCVLEMSHAVMDGASMDILLRDLARAYDGTLQDLPKPLFSPFVASLQQRNAEADVAFWTKQLSGLEPCHFPLLTDGIVVPESERQLCTLRLEFPELATLQAFCGSKGFTLPNAFHAAWGLTLACYTGAEDVCFGYLVSGRDAALLEGSEDAVGPFINMATQRVRLGDSEDDSKNITLLRLLEAVQRDQLDCMPYAQTSLAEVQHALNVPGGMALFNTCISYRRLKPKTNRVQESVVCEDVAAIHDPTEYPISLNVEMDDEGGAAIDVDYWNDAVSSAQAKQVVATFVQALLNIAERADTPVSQLDHVHPTSKELIWGWNANMPPTIVDCMHHMVEKQVAIRPQSQAVRGWDRDFTYEELNTAANLVAQHLFGLGVGPEILVPVCFDKSAWTVVAMLAVLKAGGGVVPLDATHPASALEGKVADAGAHVVVASEARASILEAMVPYVVAVGPALLAQLSAETTGTVGNVQSGVGPENAAWIMFTSGSTGKPKGSILCHQALVSSCLAHGAALGLGPHTRFLQFATHTFDNSIEEMFTTMIHGGCVCVPSEADRLGDLPGAIDKLDANFMDLTPTVAAMLRPEEVPKIRGMAVGGEALTREVLDIWGGAIPVNNQYGPSECSINATHKLHLDAKGDVATIGKSVGSVSWIVDPKDHNRLVPVGCVGELLIEGPILARGYLNRPVETDKVFIEMPEWASSDPHHDGRGSRRMYKTGDLVRYNSDGSLVYLGRKDTQVKLHGQRIELGEIEHHVKSQLPPNAQSSVELVVPADSKKALAVFICLQSVSQEEPQILPMDTGFHTLAQTIVGVMATQVASYMVPRLFFPVSRMPMTSSGKLDRRSLRNMAQALPDGVSAYRLGTENPNGRAPETLMEKQLQELWATVLNVPAESISADDTFFRHGGDSVGAMRLVAAARRQGMQLTVASIFQSPKLSKMAELAIGGRADGSAKSEANAAVQDEPLPGPVEPFTLLKEKGAMGVQELQEHVASICRVDVGAIEDIYPCNPLQAGLVALSQRQPGAYVAVNLYELPAGIDISRFKKAWQEVVDAEAILRTRVVFVENIGFLQVVVRGEINWSTAASAAELSTASYRQLPPHDGGILSRYTLIGENSNRPTFAWTSHHALYDGWSLPTLLGRVEARYRNAEAPMSPVPHYSRFVEHLASLDESASDAFWTEKLSGSGTTAPQHFPQLPHPGYRVQASEQIARTLRFTKPKDTSVTLASFLRAAWALSVSIYASSDDIVFGEILNGRDVPVAGIEDLVGPTLASVPRRIRIDRAMSVQAMLADVQSQLNDVIPHQFAGLQRIKTLNPAAAAACDFRNLLAIDMADDVAEDSLWSNLAGGGTTQGADFFSYPLNVTCTVGKTDEIQVRAFFDAGVVPQWQVSRMLGQFETLLLRLTSAEFQRETVGDMDLLSADDKASLREWNSAAGPLVERPVHDMILETMARQGTDATAVVGWDATLSNGELDALSTALARELRSKGVGPGGRRFVPFCFEKSTFAAVAMLAVLKAGAAFVPLDPAHPVARLREIVGDCNADVVLCSPKYEKLCAEVVSTVIPVDMAGLKKLEAAASATLT